MALGDREKIPVVALADGIAVVGCLVTCLAGCTATVQGPNAAEPAPGPSAPVAAVPVPSVRVLQLNLCNSGIAGCFTGRSTAVAAAAIRAGSV